VKIILLVDRAGKLLCRPAERASVPDVGQAFTIEDEDPAFASNVLAVATGPNRVPLVYGGPWPHHADDTDLKRHGFRACDAKEREAIEAELAKAGE
jgi:hypothetical protein